MIPSGLIRIEVGHAEVPNLNFLQCAVPETVARKIFFIVKYVFWFVLGKYRKSRQSKIK